jgi:hypothetical protein
MDRLSIAALALIVLLLWQGTAYAYIDPGAGGLFYQVIILLIGAVAGYFAVFKGFIKNLFSSKKDKDSTAETDK